MRAVWINPLIDQPEYILKDDVLHHLVNVVRVEIGEELLLLNGEGFAVETKIESISKRELRVTKIRSTQKDQSYHFDLAIGMPKRESLELCLKQATELGFRKIYLIKSDYSQMKFPEADRMHKLLVSALEQSNAPYLPSVEESTWENLPWNSYDKAILLDSQTKISGKKEHQKRHNKHLLIVGPEGGFSPQEIAFLHGKEQVQVVNLPTPILRTSTAVPTGAGLMIQSLLN